MDPTWEPGHNIGEDYMHELLDLLDNKDYSIVVISKSGTTTEPAIAFRLLKNHLDGEVPYLRISIPRLDEFNLGALLYFFEIACGISGYTLGINPYKQPGLEAYKKNMFALLGKPGFEEETAHIKSRI